MARAGGSGAVPRERSGSQPRCGGELTRIHHITIPITNKNPIKKKPPGIKPGGFLLLLAQMRKRDELQTNYVLGLWAFLTGFYVELYTLAFSQGFET